MEFKIDLHTHTIGSGHAYSTLKENLEEAHAKGMELIALTEHGPQMPDAPHLYYFGNMRVLPRKYLGVELLRGVEANILDFEGRLDVPDEYLKRLDIVLAGFHPGCFEPGTVEENTLAMINAMRHPLVDIIVHPGNPEYPIDPEKLVEASKELGVALEINNSSLGEGSRKGSLENCRLIAKFAAQKGSLIALGSDAHWAPLIGDFTKAVKLIEEVGLSLEQILNTDKEKVYNYLKSKRRISGKQLEAPRI